MNANELRIGNYIYWLGWDFNEGGRFLDGTKDEIIVNIDFLQSIINEEESYSPIPLTKEWLLKFGFECYNKISMVFKKYHNEANLDYSFITLKQVGNPIWDYCAYKQYTNQPLFTEIKYVHQLQNLYFALIGDELTIKPD